MAKCNQTWAGATWWVQGLHLPQSISRHQYPTRVPTSHQASPCLYYQAWWQTQSLDVNDRYLTQVPLNSIYAGIISLCGIQYCLILGELNNMEAYATDIGSVCFLKFNKWEKVYQGRSWIQPSSWPSADHLQGHIYGLWSPGRNLKSHLLHVWRA